MSFAPPPFVPPPEGDPRRSLRDALEREAAEVDARVGQLEGLAAEAAIVEAELRAIHERHADERAAAAQRLGDVAPTRRCGRGFWALPGSAFVRECDCGVRVVDPARMSARDVRAALGVDRAARLFVRDDGAVASRLCDPVAARRALSALLAACGAVAALVLAVTLAARLVPPSPAHLSGPREITARPLVGYAVELAPRHPLAGTSCGGDGCAWHGPICRYPVRHR